MNTFVLIQKSKAEISLCVPSIMEAKEMCLSYEHVCINSCSTYVYLLGGGPGLTWRVCVLGGGDAEKGDGMKETWIAGWREGGGGEINI